KEGRRENVEATFETYVNAVEQAIQATPLLAGALGPASTAAIRPPREGEVPEPLKSAMRYSLTLPGKRLRPALLLASYHLLAEDWQNVLPFAVALEMIHAYSLVHDDLPALDNDDLRRGQPSNHKAFGENIAILAGDGLYSLAFETMLDASVRFRYPRRALAAMEMIAHRAGVRGMIAGQTLDVKLEGTPPDAQTVGYIHRHKTADLLTAAVLSGLMLAGATKRQRAAGEAYGQNLGMAFQIVDDLLDLQGDTLTLGKRTGMDAQRGKMTWPAVYGEHAAHEDAARYLQNAVEAVTIFEQKATLLSDLAGRMLYRVR
ncbi:MAG: polyprenyl synthetase family protein, partial [Eubacteriales bacterium]|nr:polyprenyl synthetase family protein [Eubacteriales bacterium]